MNENRPCVTVITPTYNRAHIIERSINSVLKQTYQDFEYIIVDDGSSDKTDEVIARLGDRRIRYFKHEVNKGQNAALNTGLGYAKGKYVAFLDSDDEWLPQMLKKQVDTFEENPAYGCSYAWAGSLDPSGNLHPVREYSISGSIYSKALGQGYVCNPSTLMVKRDCIEEIGQFNLEFITCQDDDFCMRLAKHFQFGLIREVLAIIHHDSGNQTIKNRVTYATDWYKFFKKYEPDILTECGKEIMAKHYLKAAKLLIKISERSLSREAARQSLKFDPSLMGLLIYALSLLPKTVLQRLFK